MSDVIVEASRSRSACAWCHERLARTRLFPSGTLGGRIAGTKKPAAAWRAERSTAAAGGPVSGFGRGPQTSLSDSLALFRRQDCTSVLDRSR